MVILPIYLKTNPTKSTSAKISSNKKNVIVLEGFSHKNMKIDYMYIALYQVIQI